MVSDRSTIITGIKIAPAAAALVLVSSLLLAACGGGGSSSSSGGGTVTAPIIKATASPSPAATATAVSVATANPSDFTCPTTGAVGTASLARFGTGETSRHGLKHAVQLAATGTTLLAVKYASSALTASNVRLIAAREQASSATLVNSYDFPALGSSMRVIAVPTAQVAQTESVFRAQSGVQSVGVTGQRRFSTTSTALTTTDPYFQGFTTAAYPANALGEVSTIPGQWDMHVIGLDHAFGYSLTGNTVAANQAALGSSSIKIAIIDTGEDASHPELTSKISAAHERCFITNAAGTSQSTGTFVTDPDGHGTDVSGIAAAATANNLGFAGAGGKAIIYAYRVFPTPDDTCGSDTATGAQCSSDTADIASAINDAVANGVNVISMSLGGGACTNGVDQDTVEGAAVTNALAAKIIVVAASGNDSPSTSGVTAPACDSGVIAVGATALDDGAMTGTTSYSSSRTAAATSSNIVEYVPSYSQYGTTNSLRSMSSWGIVAPGGDPSSAANDLDDLHWIENIWTSTPFEGAAGASDTTFQGDCYPDYPAASNSSGTIDCRTLIAGTSMSTPHVAGAAALILAVNASYQSPAAMKQLLCATADDLSDTHQGCGRLNVYRAMATALGDPTPP